MLGLSIIVAIVVAAAAFVMAVMLDDGTFEEQGYKISTSTGVSYLTGSIGLGLTVGLIDYFTPRIASVLWLAPVFLAIMVGLTIGLVIWWLKEGSTLTEMIPALVLLGLFTFVTRAAAAATTALWTSPFWDSVASAGVWILMIIALGVIIASWAKFRFMDMAEDDDDDWDDE